ncbi:MAG: MOSC domain-containing protein [Desulfatiglandales bacterium]
MRGRIVSLAMSRHKGTKKDPVEEVCVRQDHGVEGDAHAGPWHRQVSLLASESIQRAKEMGLEASFGDFGENIATLGIDWTRVPLGSRIRIGEVELELTQIGKECHRKCAIYYMAGDCIMPREGVFARVIKGGTLRVGDSIEVQM